MFKVDSSDKGQVEEELRESRTRNIKKIAVKKSQDKAFKETSTDHRKKYSTNRTRKHSATSERSVSQAPKSSTSTSSVKSNNRKIHKKNKDDESETQDKHVQVCHKSAKKSVKNSDTKTTQVSQHNCISGSPDEKEVKYQVVKSSVTSGINEKQDLAHKDTNTVIPFDRDIINKSPHNHRNQTRPSVSKLPNLNKDQIEKEIKSIEECIIHPRKIRKANLKQDTTTAGKRREKSGGQRMNTK